jgi:hypothetical protein
MSLPFVIPAQNGVVLSGGAGGGAEFTPAALVERLAELENLLLALDPALPVGVVGDNSPAWLLADLALLSAGRCAVPIPAFFRRIKCGIWFPKPVSSLCFSTDTSFRLLRFFLICRMRRLPQCRRCCRSVPKKSPSLPVPQAIRKGFA